MSNKTTQNAITTQKLLQASQPTIFTVDILEICLLLPLSIFYLYLAYRGQAIYRTNWFNMSLLISNGLAMLMYIVSLLVLLVTDQYLINADETNLISAFHNRMKAFKFCWWFSLFYTLIYWITHWIFAFKYWTLARKFERIQIGQDPNSINRQSLIVIVFGIIFNCLGALLLVLSIMEFIPPLQKKIISGISLFFTIPLYVSWLVLADAFRRFKNSKQQMQVISNIKVLSMVITYFFYAFGASLVASIELIHADTGTTIRSDVNTLFIGYGFLYVASGVSDLVLAIVINKLMVAQWRQNQPYEDDTERIVSVLSGQGLGMSSSTSVRPTSIDAPTESSLEAVSRPNSVYSDQDQAILATVFQNRVSGFAD